MKKYFVHRYKWSHEGKRKLFRKWKRQGLVKVLQTSSQGWLYGSEYEIETKYFRKKQTHTIKLPEDVRLAVKEKEAKEKAKRQAMS